MGISVYRNYGLPSLFNSLHGRHLSPYFRTRGAETRDCWTPAVDIHETGETLTFEFEMPGVRKEDITLEYKDGVLSLTGEKKAAAVEEETRFFTRERCLGTFNRSFRIGDGYDPTTVAAKHADGILRVTVTKKEEARPVSIQVQ